MDIGNWARRSLSLVIGGCLVSMQLSAADIDPVTAVQTVTPATAQIGDLLTYELSVTYNEPVQLVNVGTSGIIPPFAVINFKKIREKKSGKNVFRYVAKISPFATGTFTIRERTIRYKTGHQVGSFVVPEIQVDVLSVLTATSNYIEDVKAVPPLALPVAQLGLLLGSLGVMGGGGIVYLLVKRRNSQSGVEIVAEVDDRSIEQIAMMDLENATLNIGEYQSFYVALSDILRSYLGARFGIESQEMTTAELGREIDAHCESTLAKRAGRILHLCDLVKFAKFVPTIEDSWIAVDRVRGIVTQLGQSDGEETVDEAS